jgi:hypothetical protein
MFTAALLNCNAVEKNILQNRCRDPNDMEAETKQGSGNLLITRIYAYEYTSNFFEHHSR